jgi:non-specific serine/threonine protein kinase
LAGAGLLAEQRGDGVLGERFFTSARAEAHASGDGRSEVFAAFGLGRLALGRGDAAEARRDCEQSLALCRQLDEPWLAAELLEWLGYIAWHEGDLARSEQLFRQSVGAFRDLGDERGAARALEGLGFLAVDRDDRAAAIPLLQEGLVALAHAHNPREQMLGIAGEATSNVLSGRLVEALRLFQEVLGTAELLGNPIIQGQGLIAVADVLAAGGEARPAARLLGAATSCFEAAGTKLQLLERRRYEEARKRTRSALGLEPSDAAEAAGRELTLEQAVEEARRARLGSSDIDPTTRELEILRLVAAGLSNAEIARTLVVSVRTVHAHLRSIYRKFGVHTRTAAARAAAEKGLV